MGKVNARDWAKAQKHDKADPAAIKLLKDENRALRARMTSAGAKAEILFEAVKEALADYEPPVVKPPKERKRKAETEVAVLHLSDTQFGKITKTYDSEIATKRVEEYITRSLQCVEAHRHYANVDEAVLLLGGDMIEGEQIFPGQAHLIDQPVIDQAVMTCPRAIADAVLRLASQVKRLRVVCVAGNHGRPTSKHAGSHPKTNWDRVCYETARMMVGKQAGVTWSIPDDFYAVTDVLGHKLLMVHGHQIRGGFGGFPFYGVGKKLAGWIDSVPEDWHHLFVGHFHTPAMGSINGRFWFCNGTTESDNEYAREELAASGRPTQRLQFWNKSVGLVADRLIYLTYGIRP